MYEEEDDEVQVKVKIPKYKLLHNDIDKAILDKVLECIVYYNIDATLSLPDAKFDKDIATKLKRKLDEDPELNIPSSTSQDSIYIYNIENVEEHGVWQVLIGKHYVASVSYDAKYLVYFYFEDLAKYFLVFRS